MYHKDGKVKQQRLLRKQKINQASERGESQVPYRRGNTKGARKVHQSPAGDARYHTEWKNKPGTRVAGAWSNTDGGETKRRFRN